MYLIDFLVIYLLFLESLFYKISTLVPVTAFGIANITPQSKKVLYNNWRMMEYNSKFRILKDAKLASALLGFWWLKNELIRSIQ